MAKRTLVHVAERKYGFGYEFHGSYREDGKWKTFDFVVNNRILKRPDWEILLRQIVKASLNG
ncbi:hypothetical protein Ql52_gp003 [Caulobacter phage Quill_5.2]|uniref:Uncharacterized protein n=1 Tax=Caulobacter phage Quill_5.2 TaxID=3075108 RepID=A0AA96PWU8_9CAUD|nr:hypothetical protein Ql52_gp003 [Caulobacter phage Quill_5.2]